MGPPKASLPTPLTLSSRPERSAVERSAVMFPGLTTEAGCPPSGFSDVRFKEPNPSLATPLTLSSRPKRSAVERSAVMFPELTTEAECPTSGFSDVRFKDPKPFLGNSTYFVISTGAKRSGEICGYVPRTNHRCRVPHVRIFGRAIQGPQTLPWQLHLLCHLDRSEAQWRDLRLCSQD